MSDKMLVHVSEQHGIELLSRDGRKPQIKNLSGPLMLIIFTIISFHVNARA
jgi:hypothetical protein